jgi:hypothetical protein
MLGKTAETKLGYTLVPIIDYFRSWLNEDQAWHCFNFFQSLFSVFFPLLLCWVRVHYGILKGSYNVSNISYFNSPSPLLSFSPLPPFLEQVQKVSFLHLYTSVHMISTVFILVLLSPLQLPAPTIAPSTCSALLFSIL